MDSVITQLATLSLGVVDLFIKKKLPSQGIYAVDKEVDEWGNPI